MEDIPAAQVRLVTVAVESAALQGQSEVELVVGVTAPPLCLVIRSMVAAPGIACAGNKELSRNYVLD